jgi:hypothetical protein
MAGEHHHRKLHPTPHIIDSDQPSAFVQLYLAFYEGIMCWFDWFEAAPSGTQATTHVTSSKVITLAVQAL